jgi:hypothetical protein
MPELDRHYRGKRHHYTCRYQKENLHQLGYLYSVFVRFGELRQQAEIWTKHRGHTKPEKDLEPRNPHNHRRAAGSERRNPHKKKEQAHRQAAEHQEWNPAAPATLAGIAPVSNEWFEKTIQKTAVKNNPGRYCYRKNRLIPHPLSRGIVKRKIRNERPLKKLAGCVSRRIHEFLKYRYAFP